MADLDKRLGTVSGSQVGGYMAREECLTKLPNNPIWYEMDVETWSDTGSKINLERNKRHNASRQNSRPTVSGFDYLAGYSNKLRPSNNDLAFESLMYADFRARPNPRIMFGAGDLALTVNDETNIVTLKSTNFVGFRDVNGFHEGTWIGLFSDDATNHFSKQFFGRVCEVVSNNEIRLDRVSTPLVDDAGVGLTIEMHVGRLIRNEKELELIKETSVTIKRTLGTYDGKMQSQNIEGCVASQLKISAPVDKPVSCEFNYIAVCDMNNTEDVSLTAANTEGYVIEDAFNTSSDIYQSVVTMMDEDGPATDQIIGIVMNAEISINNNLKAVKGHTIDAGKSRPGGFSVSAGSFDVDGKIDIYLNTVANNDTVKEGSNLAYHLILARKGEAFILDVPDLMAGNGIFNVPAEEEVTIPLDGMASECKNGYTVGLIFFENLPDSAMPTTNCN